MPNPQESQQAILNGLVDGNYIMRVSTLGGDAGTERVSAFSPDASQFRVSAIQDGGAALNVSAKSNDGALFRTSAIQDGAAALNVSAKSNDGALFRVSAIQDGAAALNVSAKSQDGALFRTSAILDNGSVSAKSGDANQVHVSAVQGDAGLFLTSAKQGDASLFRVSSFESAVTTGTGGTSLFSTSAGIAQTSAIKSSTGRLYGVSLFNPNVVPQYLQVFDVSATTSVTLGTTVANAIYGLQASGVFSEQFAPGLGFSNGIVIAVTSAAGGATAGANAMTVNVFYS